MLYGFKISQINYCIEDEDIESTSDELGQSNFDIEKEIKQLRSNLPKELIIKISKEELIDILGGSHYIKHLLKNSNNSDQDTVVHNFTNYITDQISNITGWLINSYSWEAIEENGAI